MNKVLKVEKKPTAVVCPKCDGLKKYNDEPCPLCDGTGAVFSSRSYESKAGDYFTK